MPTHVATGQLTLVDLNDSVQLTLSLPAVVLPANASGTVSSFATAVSTARVMQGGADVTSSWALSKADSNCTSTLAAGVITVSALSADAGSVTVTATRAGWPTLTAVFALSKAKQGATGAAGDNAISAMLSNEAHIVPVDSSGAGMVYTGAGTSIWVFEGPAALAYDGVGTSNGTWKVTAAGTSITPGAINDGGAAAWTSVPSAMTADTASIVYTITGKSSSGGSFSLTKTQTLTKVRAGADGANGASAVSAMLSNESCSVPADASGAVTSYGSTSTAISVFEGTTALTYDGTGTSNGTWKVTRVGTNITPGGVSDGGDTALVANAGAMTADTAQVTYTITGKTVSGSAVSLTKVQTFTKSIKGETGAPALGSVPSSWSPGVVGGSGDFTWKLNYIGTTANPGEITSTATKLLHPNGTVYTSGLSGTLFTPYGEGMSGTFYVVFTPDRAALLPGMGDIADTANNLFIARPRAGGGWEAINNQSATLQFTPTANELIIAAVHAEGATSGLTALVPLVGGSAGADGANAISMVLTNAAHVVPADSSGNVTNWSGASTTPKIYVGATDDTANWTLAKTDSACTSVLSSGVVTVSAMSADTAYVDITATRSGYATQTARFTITKSKAGATGSTGATGAAGANATAYWLTTSAPAVQKNLAGVYTPSSVTFSLMRAVGTSAPAAYAGRFIIATSTDGTNYTNQYTSASDESSKAYTVPAGIKTIRVRGYLAGGTTTLLDEQILTVVSDGATGATGATGPQGPAGASGASALVAVLSNEAHVFPASSTGVVSNYANSGTAIRVYEGATELAYDGVGTANGTWKIATTPTNITVGTITDSGSYASVAGHSAMPDGVDTASIIYTLTGKSSTGTSFTLTKTQTFTKAKVGATGATGATGAAGATGATGATGAAGAAGADATVRWLVKSAGMLKRDNAGTLAPPSITFTAYSQTGTGSPAAYAGRFIVATSSDGSSYTDQYTSAANESSTTYSPPATTNFVRCRLYLAGGTTTLIDEEVVPILAEGARASLVDASWWKPGATTWPSPWWKWQNGPADEVSFVNGTGPTAQAQPLLRCIADSINKCYTPNAGSATSFWFLDGGESGGVAPTLSVNTTQGWTADGSTTYSGNCFQVTKATLATNSHGIASRAIAVTPGEVLRIRVRVRGDTATSSGLYIRINQATSMPASGAVNVSNRASYTQLFGNVACTSTYTTYQNLTYTVPAGIVAISLVVFSWANGPLTLYVDDPTVNRVAHTDSAVGPRQDVEGGFGGARVSIDPTKTYRFVVPFCRDNSTYSEVNVGPTGNQVCNLNTSTLNPNPYFRTGGVSSLTVGRWYLAVGYVYPAGSTGMSSATAGTFDALTGLSVGGGGNFCWPAGQTVCDLRAAQWYADNGAQVKLAPPWVHVVDGTEPPLSSFAPPSEILNAQQRWSDVQAIPFTSIGGDADSTSLGFNGAFLNWPTTATYPVGWSVWSAGTITRDTSVVRDADGTPSMKMVCTGVNTGVSRTVNLVDPLPAGSFLWGSIDLHISARTAGLPLVLVRLYTNAALTTYVDTQVIPATTVGSWQRLSWTARTTNLTDRIYGIQVFLMGRWTSGSGGAFTGTCYFENLFFEMVDKSIDNRSLQFSEVSGALTFTPNGNGTSTFTAVTANNKVTSSNVGNYIAQGAITASNSASQSSSRTLAPSSDYTHTYSNAAPLTVTPYAAGTQFLVTASVEAMADTLPVSVKEVVVGAELVIGASAVHSTSFRVNPTGLVGSGLNNVIAVTLPLLHLWSAPSTSSVTISARISYYYYDSNGSVISVQPFHTRNVKIVAIENRA